MLRDASMTTELYLNSYLEDLRWTLREIDLTVFDRIAAEFLRARDEGRQILIIGNGGSAATASHMACDLGKGTIDFKDPAFTRFRTISLSDNCALMTALGNDLSFGDVFTEQLKIVMRDGDIVVLISASGNSPNLVKAAEYASTRGAIMVGLLGFGGGRLAAMVNHALVVSSRNYGIAEDFHLIVQHVLTQHLKRVLAGPARRVAFVDRDGIINERAAEHQYVERWDQFRFIDGARTMLRDLAARGYAIVVVTNQQGVGKGRMGHETLKDIHQQMSAAVTAEGVRIDGIFVCPHLESAGCFCRKPQPGLIQRALNELPFLVDLERSLMIGDADTDMRAAQLAGVPTRVFVGPGKPDAATHAASTVSGVSGIVAKL